MSDYKRLVSYIYSYPGGVREKNVGFAKAEVRGGQFKLFVSLKGVYTDAPENFGVYLMFDKDDKIDGRYTLLPIGSLVINNGLGKYNDLLNPENINSSGYKFADINGIAVARRDNRYYMMFSLWADGNVAPDSVNFVERGYKKPDMQSVSQVASVHPISSMPSEQVSSAQQVTTAPSDRGLSTPQMLPNEDFKDKVKAAEAEGLIDKTSDRTEADSAGTKIFETAAVTGDTEPASQSQSQSSEPTGLGMPTVDDLDTKEVQSLNLNGFDKIFTNADYIDVFDDDYYYDCIEVSPEQLRELPIDDEAIINNSFLLHGYYNFKHILFGKVRENERHTRYFIGVPGMYCNRERFMASMFAFNNFKKSCRSDYSNPYFGYWYQEI